MTLIRDGAAGVLCVRRAQLLPDPAHLGVGGRVPRLLGRQRAVDLAHRRRPGQQPAGPVPDDRGDLLELPVGRVQLDRRDDRRRTLGGHARVHDDGADPAVVAAHRPGVVRDGLRPDPHGGHLRRPRALLPAPRPVEGEPGHGRRVHGPRLVQLRRHRDPGRDPAAAVRRARRPDDVRRPVVPAAGQRRLLLDRHPAAVDAGAVAPVAGDVRPRRRPGRADRRGAGDRAVVATSGRWSSWASCSSRSGCGRSGGRSTTRSGPASSSGSAEARRPRPAAVAQASEPSRAARSSSSPTRRVRPGEPGPRVPRGIVRVERLVGEERAGVRSRRGAGSLPDALSAASPSGRASRRRWARCARGPCAASPCPRRPGHGTTTGSPARGPSDGWRRRSGPPPSHAPKYGSERRLGAFASSISTRPPRPSTSYAQIVSRPAATVPSRRDAGADLGRERARLRGRAGGRIRRRGQGRDRVQRRGEGQVDRDVQRQRRRRRPTGGTRRGPSRSGGSGRPGRRSARRPWGPRPGGGTGRGWRHRAAARCAASAAPTPARRATAASNGRSEPARAASSRPRAGRRRAASPAPTCARGRPGRISVSSPAHSLGRSSDRNAFAYGSSRTWSLWRWMTPRISRSSPASSGTEARYGQTCAVESRSHIASMSPVSDERVGPLVRAAGDDRRVERVRERSFEQPAKAGIGDPARPRSGCAARWPRCARHGPPARAAPRVRCPVGRWVMSAGS